MRFFLILVSLSYYSSILTAKTKVKVFYEEVSHGYEVFVDNNEPYTICIGFSFQLKNLFSREGNNKVFIVPANKRRHNITRLIAQDFNHAYSFKYRYRYDYGNFYSNELDNDYIYKLPFKKGRTFRLIQGYNGKFSHRGKNALDFAMPIGSEIHAIRPGIVVDLEFKNHKGCGKRKCSKYANFIVVNHDDGSFASYYHLKKNGVSIKIGEKITEDQLIGHSGNTGFSTRPHLHLEVFLPNPLGKRKTLRTPFYINNGTSDFLIEKQNYTKH